MARVSLITVLLCNMAFENTALFGLQEHMLMTVQKLCGKLSSVLPSGPNKSERLKNHVINHENDLIV